MFGRRSAPMVDQVLKPNPKPFVKMARLGVLGGGQLGRMFVHAAQRLGVEVVVLDPDCDAPAAQAANRHLCAAYDDPRALDELAALCSAVTTEFENVPAASLQRLAETVRVAPAAHAVAIAQDRLAEKRLFRAIGIPTAEFFALPGDRTPVRGASPAGAERFGTGAEGFAPCPLPPGFCYPALVKTRRMGYDGKGQMAVASASEVEKAWRALGGVDCIVETRLTLHAELSVIMARGFEGTTAIFPVFENVHAHGILASSRMPARQDPRILEQACQMTRSIALALNYHGVLCVEYFVVSASEGLGTSPASENLRLVANEMAPRPHNSGHATIDACSSSQFEQQVRVLAGWPLGGTQPYRHACLINVLGDRWWNTSGVFREPRWSALLALPGVALHRYGKREARPGRKMGHLSVCAASAEELDARAAEVMAVLECLSFE